MDRTRFELTSKELLFVIVGSQVATAMLSLPRVVAVEAQQHAWLAVIMGTVVPLTSIFLTVALYNRFQDPDFVNVSHRLFGKILGSVLVLIFVIYIVLFQGIVIRLFAEITCVFMLPTTPIWAVSLVSTFSVVFAVCKGGKVIGRINEFFFYLLVVDLLIIFVPVNQGTYLNLLPLGEIDLNGLIKGSLKTAYAYAGAEILFITYAVVQQRREILKAALIGQGITVSIYLLVVVVCLMVFGTGLKFITWPLLTVLKLPYVYALGRLEIIFLLLWVGLGLRPAMNLGMAACYTAVRNFNLDFNRWYKWVVLGMGTALYVLSLQADNLLQVFTWADYAGYAFLAVSLGYPLLYLLAALLRGEKSK